MFGKECLQENKYTYLYKGKVQIPPLSMVDDIICVSQCGFKSVMINYYLTCKTSIKKLQFEPGKCKKVHIGKDHEQFNATLFLQIAGKKGTQEKVMEELEDFLSVLIGEASELNLF